MIKPTVEIECAATPAVHRRYMDSTRPLRRLDPDEIFHALILSGDHGLCATGFKVGQSKASYRVCV